MLLCYVFYPKAGSAAWQPQGGSLTHMAFRGGASSGASRGLAPTRAPHIHSTTPCHYILGIALPPDDGVAGMTGGRMGQATCSELSGGEIKHGAGLGVDGPLWVPGMRRLQKVSGRVLLYTSFVAPSSWCVKPPNLGGSTLLCYTGHLGVYGNGSWVIETLNCPSNLHSTRRRRTRWDAGAIPLIYRSF